VLRKIFGPKVYVRVATSKYCVIRNFIICLMFVDPCIIAQFIKKSPTRCNNVSKFYYSLFT